MSAKETWQTERPTIRERTKFMLNNHLFSDVKFVIRKSENADGESESKEVIPAHKFVLSIGSPVFEAMFYGELAETSDCIELPDCEYESVLELFRYMYSDEVKLSGSNVMGVLYLAKKYMVPSLADKCSEYLRNHLDASNVFSILPTADKYEEKDLVDRCWKVIDTESEAAVKSEGFATIESSLLAAVVSRDTLRIKEIELFKAVDLWATRKCEKQGLEANGEAKRGVLGERVVKAIRFPVMEEQEFAAVVVDTKILSPDEVINLFKFFNSLLATPVGFSEKRRSGTSFSICRFDSVSTCSLHFSSSKPDFLIFSVSTDVTLHGLHLFGSKNNDYTVVLMVKDFEKSLTVVSKRGKFTSKLLQNKNSSYYGFEVVFDKPVDLLSNTRYLIEANISGPPSWVGLNGFSTVETSDVKVTFTTFKLPNGNATSATFGQFPEFQFSLRSL